jgi:hypothetical protein
VFARRREHVQAGVGHYGVFAGSRFEQEIYPEIRRFVARSARRSRAAALARGERALPAPLLVVCRVAGVSKSPACEAGRRGTSGRLGGVQGPVGAMAIVSMAGCPMMHHRS